MTFQGAEEMLQWNPQYDCKGTVATCFALILQFPDAGVLNKVGCRNAQMTAKERKSLQQKSANASPQKSANESKRAQKSAKERFRVKIANNQVWELPTHSSHCLEVLV